jgi:hypothetical protein
VCHSCFLRNRNDLPGKELDERLHQDNLRKRRRGGIDVDD